MRVLFLHCYDHTEGTQDRELEKRNNETLHICAVVLRIASRYSAVVALQPHAVGARVYTVPALLYCIVARRGRLGFSSRPTRAAHCARINAGKYPRSGLEPATHVNRFGVSVSGCPGAGAGAILYTLYNLPADVRCEVLFWGRLRARRSVNSLMLLRDSVCDHVALVCSFETIPS
ncbi:hypothetical protein EVAR_80111_1 [Eumeta japonica]|uniref:Uncharacterized protein n=1 Tax=Eumeta variegata TaxID=151549 RepID=A0A4C1UD10_EUMVA|nr:hypothetical protein EVAR_80111_1 [Eumeta japonica]